MEKIIVLVTAPNEDEAARIGRALVDERLAACVNIIPRIRSVYRWKGDVCDDSECLMVIKTLADGFGALEKRVKELHSYEVPEVIALPVVKGSSGYLAWVEENSCPDRK